MSETSRALFRKSPLHLSQGCFRLQSLGPAVTSADHRADINRALQYNKGKPARPSIENASRAFPSPTPQTAVHEVREPQGVSLSKLPRPPKSNLRTLLGYGDLHETEAFPGAPSASRGFPGGGHSKWGFERVPSLLPSHLERDRGMRGRSCAGLPPSASLLPSGSAASLAPATSAWWSDPSGDARKLPRSHSTGHLKPEMRGGLEVQSPAGSTIRGSDGRFLGY